ncbi:MAG TPA: enoyl-CoA hydratase-related protein [Anaerolineales bacterium]
MSERKYVLTAVEENVFLITIDHPPVNSLNTQTISELNSALDEFTGNPTYKVAIITGGEMAVFVSGADISESEELIASGNIKDFILRGQGLLRKISECSKPVIAAINGLALGGGMELAMACHLRIMADRAKLAQPEINLGIIPGWGGTQMLPKIVGSAKARELILTGESISAQEAFRLNLVNKVVPRKDVLKTAKELARKIARKGTLAIRAAMDSICMSTHMEVTDGLAYEAVQVMALIGSEDAREGLKAFLEKRPPVFREAA